MSENTPELSFDDVNVTMSIPAASNDLVTATNNVIVNFQINQDLFNNLEETLNMTMDIGFFNNAGLHSYVDTTSLGGGNAGNGGNGGIDLSIQYGFFTSKEDTRSQFGSWTEGIATSNLINNCGNYFIEFKQERNIFKDMSSNFNWVNKVIFSFRNNTFAEDSASFFSIDFPAFGTTKTLSESDFTFVGTGDGIRIYDNQSNYFTSLGINCLIKGTNILTPKGNVKIEDLKRGDIILNSNNQEKRIKKKYKQVVNVDISKSHRDMYADKYSLKGDTELIVSGGHMVKLDGEYHLPINSSKFENIQKQNSENEYYHLELGDYDFFIANGIEVESLCHDEEQKENYYKDRGLSYQDLIKSKK